MMPIDRGRGDILRRSCRGSRPGLITIDRKSGPTFMCTPRVKLDASRSLLAGASADLNASSAFSKFIENSEL
jgi:hypothetical protein